MSVRFLRCGFLPRVMTLNRLLDVLTPENTYGLNERTIYEAAFKEKAKLLWGIVYAEDGFFDPTSASGRKELVRVQLIYQGIRNGKLYLVRPNYSKISPDSSPDAEFNGVPETRAQLFKTNEDYIRFFSALNERRKNGKITNEEYIAVFNKITKLANSIPPPSISEAILKMVGKDQKRKVIDESHFVMQSDPLIIAILSEAGIIL